MPVLAELGAPGGSRLVTLGHRTGAAREPLRQALDGLIAAGLTARNPGYGHPMRPEYVLTARGRLAAPRAAELIARLRDAGLERVGLKKWTLPVLVLLHPRARFSELRARLRVTSRALTLALKDLEAAGLAERLVTDDRPPASYYRPTELGGELAAAARRLLDAAAA